jgi:hypothetical protein
MKLYSILKKGKIILVKGRLKLDLGQNRGLGLVKMASI